MSVCSLIPGLGELYLLDNPTGSPDYVTTVRPGDFPKVLRNIHLPTMALYALLMLLVLANIPLDIINGGSNILSALAEQVSLYFYHNWHLLTAIGPGCGKVDANLGSCRC